MVRKKKILLNWWYDRADLLAPFLALRQDIEFVLIFYKKPSGKEAGLPFRIIFWDDFSTPYKLLDAIKPDKVVFINIDDNPYQISLNIACVEKGIDTAICDHGMRGFSEIPAHRINFSENKATTFRFLVSALNQRNLHLLPKLILLLTYKLQGVNKGRTGNKLRQLRKPKRYICYSASSAQFFKERDNAHPDQFSIIGNPGFDKYFTQTLAETSPASNYYLLIDQPFVKSQFTRDLLKLEEKNLFLKKLVDYCHSQGHKLLVKLHPDDYGQDYYLEHPLIEYFEDADLHTLLNYCTGVFGFYSTLMVPSITFKKCFVFRLKEIPIQTLWAELGVVKMLDFYTFVPEQIQFDSFVIDPKQMKLFIEMFVYKTDGKSLERLKTALLHS